MRDTYIDTYIRWGCFQICSGKNNTLLLVYAYEVIHLINKGVISLYVQEWSGVTIVRLHYVTYYCT